MKKIKTIFEAVGQETDVEQCCINFDEYLYGHGEWSETRLDSDSFDNVIIIGRDNSYNYYLAWDDDNKGNLTLTYICRVKQGDC